MTKRNKIKLDVAKQYLPFAAVIGGNKCGSKGGDENEKEEDKLLKCFCVLCVRSYRMTAGNVKGKYADTANIYLCFFLQASTGELLLF